LALLGGGLGLLLAWWGAHLLLVVASDGSAIPLDLSLGYRVLWFALWVSGAAVLLFGVTPALRATRMDHGTTLQLGARALAGGGAARGRLSPGGVLISSQVALSVVLLVGAAMLTRSLRNVQGVDVGLDRDQLLMIDVDIGVRGYQGERLLMVAATYSENGIFSGTEWSTDIAVPGFTGRQRADSMTGTDNVGAGYFRAIGATLLAGRDIAPADQGQRVSVAVVNQAFAKFYFPGEIPIGRSFMVDDSIPISIVGVVADVRGHNLDGTVRRRAYYPYVPTDQDVSNPTELRLAVRTRDDPFAMTERVRSVVAAIDPLLPIDRLQPLSVMMRQSIREQRLVVQLASVFGALALVLASVGLYGVLTYAIKRRTGEIGLRSALGAQRSDVVRLVLSDALRLVAGGIVLGVPLAVASTRLLRGQLHGVPSIDPASIAVAVAVLGGSAVVAALVPALGASRVSPLVALRAD
jgi:predicted permease